MKHENKVKKAFLAAFPNTLPVLAGFLILGSAYGILMQTKGHGAFWAILMSVVVFAGSLQFIAIELLASVFDLIGAFLLTIMINARHLFYGLSMLDKFKDTGRLKPMLIYLLCDESFSIESSVLPPEGIEKKYFYFFISLLDYSYWILGTVIGCVGGQFIKFDTTGLDFALTALFVVLFAEQIKNKQSLISAFIGILSSVICLLLFGPDKMVIPSMTVIMIILLSGRKLICR